MESHVKRWDCIFRILANYLKCFVIMGKFLKFQNLITKQNCSICSKE